jgi:hypothetical protein
MLIVWLVALAIFGRSVVSAKMVERKTITLRRVSPAFIDALHEFRGLHPDLAFEKAIESLVCPSWRQTSRRPAEQPRQPKPTIDRPC